MPAGEADGWSWSGRHSLSFYAYPSARWLPPPLHATYRPQPLPPLLTAGDGTSTTTTTSAGGADGDGDGGGGGFTRRVWLQNKFYPEGHGTADNFWSLDELKLILDTLLPRGFQVVYNHPELKLLGSSDANDNGQARGGYQLGDRALLTSRYRSAINSRALLLLPALAQSAWAAVGYNELQLRVLAKTSCFLAPQGGASYLTFYQPGLHVVNDRTGKERCAGALLATDGRAGTYWHYFTQLAGAAGESVIYNVAGNRTRLRAALDVMARTDVCVHGSEWTGA